MARPRKEFDFEQFEQLVEFQCTEREISAFLRVSMDTLSRRIQEKYNRSFADFRTEIAHSGKAKLRKAQMEVAIEDRNVQMLIHLGKNLLDQRDKTSYDTQINHTVNATTEERQKLERMPLKELIAYVQDNLPLEKN